MRRPLLIATAVEAEAEAVRAGLPATPAAGAAPIGVVPVGVGPAAAAAGAARVLALAEAAGRPYRGVISAGIGGGFAGRVGLAAVALGVRSIAADLGADSPAGFIPLDDLGFGTTTLPADPGLLATLRAALPGAVTGDILTVSTVTGTSEGVAGVLARHPDAVAEGMEGYGVACAAREAGVPFAELRAVSNPVGPRDRAAWRIPQALAALAAAAGAVATVVT
ncbi:futalosine hydrolase [Rhizomonospora bruguierae]|uniref:futalosine hydrolase n=1 Tax=Rhizomonospora bruguierae TaxID=1581705 RepID=UPI001BD050BB|nr:futalosine hydrolase [Micromonospora sp. NBRC 107566]